VAEFKALSDPFVQKGEYGEAGRIALIAVRVAERVGERRVLGSALFNAGSIYARQMNKSAEALNYLQQSVAIFEEIGDKKELARALHSIGIAYNLERRHAVFVGLLRKESGAKS
jgi:hypothetical protein